MPKDYLEVRDRCYERKRKNGKLTEEDKKDCKKQAAIYYYKKHGKPVEHSDASFDDMDIMDMEILAGQLDFFESLDEYYEWNRDWDKGHNG